MKHINHTLFLSLFALFALVIVSCNKNPGQTKIEKETYTKVSFNFTGQEFEITETPITRAGEAKDWYAFQVYYRVAGSNNVYSTYAYGFFDNKENMIINLKNGYEYRFDVCMFVEASSRVYCFATNSGWAYIDNSFKISSSESVRYMYEGYLYMNYPQYTTYERPMVDRFMGRTDGYIPTEGGVVNIEMKRAAFAVNYKPQNFTSGKLEISLEGSGLITMVAGKDTECGEVYSFKYTGDVLTDTNYSESIPVNIIWVKDDGVRTPIANQAVTFKRNVLTTITFEVKESANSNTFNIKADESLETGETVTIGGDGTNTGVNPN